MPEDVLTFFDCYMQIGGVKIQILALIYVLEKHSWAM